MQSPRDMEIVGIDRAENLGDLKRLLTEQMTIVQDLYRKTRNDIHTKEWQYFTVNGKKWRAGSDPASENFLFQYLASGDWKIQSNWISKETIYAAPKAKITAIGGYAVALTNNTGVASVEGQLVETDDTDENSYKTADANATDVVGIVYNAGVADGSEVWIVMGGIAEVLLDAGGCVHHDRLISSATAGSADVSNAPAVAAHFQEIGHALETVVGAGLAKAMIHFL